MAGPPPKRQKPGGASAPAAPAEPAAASSAIAIVPASARRAALDGQLAPLRDKERELGDLQAELEAEFHRRLAELHRRQEQLQRQIAPLQREREAVSGYLQLLGPAHSRWSQPSYPEWAADIDFPSEPSILYAAQQRLAIAGIGSSRLGAACTL